MPHIIAEPCIGTKDTSCVAVCPVDCIHPTDEEAEFHGDHVDFDAVWSNPKPRQPGGPPVLLGASSRYAFARVARYCDGWFPIHQTPARALASGAVDYAAGIAAVKRHWEDAGRSGEPDFTIFGVGGDRDRLVELIGFGFNRLVFALPSGDADTVLPLLDRYAAVAHEINA